RAPASTAPGRRSGRHLAARSTPARAATSTARARRCTDLTQDFVGFGPIQPDGYAHVGQTSPIECGAERRSQEDGRLDSRVPDERPVGDAGRRLALASSADPGVSRLFATIRSELGEIGLAADQDESRVASSRHADDTNPRRVDYPPEDGMRDHGVEHSLDVARSAEELGVGSIRARVLEVVAWV